jgi:hypothetical protein
VIDHASPTIEVEKPWGKFEQYTHAIDRQGNSRRFRGLPLSPVSSLAR